MKTMLFASAAALVLSAGVASAAGTHPALVSKASPSNRILLPHHGTSILYDQNSATNFGIDSQNFETAYDAYDNQGADDFVVPQGKTWKISEVDANGAYYNGAGPAASFNVTFYTKAVGGKTHAEVVKASCPSASYTDAGGTGSVAISCSAKLKGGTAAAGKRYYVSVQANCDFASCGQWGWNTLAQQGKPALWKNPGDGFGSGCTTYNTLTTCIPSGESGDFAFALQGTTN